MATSEEPVDLTAAQDRLLDLLVQQDEASNLKDWPLVGALEKEIDVARADRDQLRRSD